MSEPLWVVIDIGCLHCRVKSKIVASFVDQREAEAVAAALRESSSWHDDAQHDFVALEVPIPQVVGKT